MTPKDVPITISVEDRTLVIRVSTDLLMFAFERDPNNVGWNNARQDFNEPRIVDPSAFVAEIVEQLQREGEDGNTHISDMLDHAMRTVVENGTMNVEWPDPPPAKTATV